MEKYFSLPMAYAALASTFSMNSKQFSAAWRSSILHFLPQYELNSIEAPDLIPMSSTLILGQVLMQFVQGYEGFTFKLICMEKNGEAKFPQMVWMLFKKSRKYSLNLK